MSNFSNAIRSQIRATLRRPVLTGVIFLAAIVIILYAFGFLLMAAQLWLSQRFHSDIVADLTVGSGLALVAVVIAIAGSMVRKSPTPELRTPASLAMALPVVARIAPQLLNRKVLGVASMILGVVLISREVAKR
jgi:hypothetical protein